MPPNKSSKKYNEQDLMQAVASIKTKILTVKQASIKYGVPGTTIKDRLSGRYATTMFKPGMKQKLSHAQEQRLSNFLIYRAKIGSGITRPKIPLIIKQILDSAEIESGTKPSEPLFHENLPNKSWVHRFIGRHPELSARTPEHLGHMRKCVTEQGLRNWFRNLSSFLANEHNIIAEDFLIEANSHRIFNLDETGFPLCGTSKLKVVTEKGTKNVYNVSSESKEQITVLGCVSANGDFQKPFVLFPGVRPSFNFQNVNPDNYNVGNTQNGWMTSEAFFSWFSNLFFAEIRNKVQFPILVFLDGHSSHVGLAMSEFCRKNNIILYCFPPHASHIIQPLDICVYGPLKKIWNKAITNFKEKFNAVMNKSNFFTVFDDAWETVKIKPQNVTAGFQKAGLVPFNENALDFSKVINEEASGKTFMKKSETHSVDVILGLNMALQFFDKNLSSQNKELFETRYSENYDLEDETDLNQMFRIYKSLRNILDNPDNCEENDTSIVSTPTSTPLSKSKITSQITIQPDHDREKHHQGLSDFEEAVDRDTSFRELIVQEEQSQIDSDYELPSINDCSFREISVYPESAESGYSVYQRQCTSPDPGEGTSVDPGEGTSVDAGEGTSVDPAEGPSVDPREDTLPSTNILLNESSSSNPRFYGSFEFSPFKRYLTIGEEVSVPKKGAKTKQTMPSAISGKDYFEFQVKKLEDKQRENERKEKRKKEREAKKQEKSRKATKKCTDNRTDEENEIVYDDDSADDLVLGESDDCAACGGDEGRDDPSQWIGCLNCPRWFHKFCLNANYENLSYDQIKELDFKCNFCSRKSISKK